MEATENIEVRNKISEAAFGLFCQKGVKSVSMDDIAQHLSMSKKTIYKWYSNKDEVVYSSLEAFLNGVERECEGVMDNAATAIEGLLNMMGMVRKIFSSMHPSIFHDLQKYHASSWRLWQRFKNQQMLGHIQKTIRRGIDEGLFRKDLDIDIIARLRLAQIELPFDNKLFPPEEFELKQVQLATLEHFILGIATLKGHKLINEYKHITEEE